MAAGGAVAVQANRIWLVSGATVTLNFLKKKSMPRTEPATAACKNLAVKSLPWTGRFWKQIPKRGSVVLSAPYRREPDGLALDVQGTILNVAPVSTEYLSLVISSVRKSTAFAGKMHGCSSGMCWDCRSVFRPGTRENAYLHQVMWLYQCQVMSWRSCQVIGRYPRQDLWRESGIRSCCVDIFFSYANVSVSACVTVSCHVMQPYRQVVTLSVSGLSGFVAVSTSGYLTVSGVRSCVDFCVRLCEGIC